MIFSIITERVSAMNNVNKPTIPAEVADAIEYFRNRGVGCPAWSNESIIDLVINSAAPTKKTDALRSIPFDTLLAALVNGYERKLTEEGRTHDAIRKIYVRHAQGGDGYVVTSQSKANADGIKFALDVLGVHIEGVNA